MPTAKPARVDDGTLIHGTHRPQDLVPVFINTIRALDPVLCDHCVATSPEDWDDYIPQDHPVWDTDEMAEWVHELFDALDSLAPEGMYFGANEGDGADFGFWRYEDDT